jgi:thiamine-phosphate pyrophosphorylase
MASSGVEWIQLRAKELSGESFYRFVEQTLARLGESTVRLWIDDRVDIATLFPVFGVHVGQDDLPSTAVRRVVEGRVMIGRSTHCEAQVAAADADQEVDVVALGPIFETRNKERPDPVVGLEGLRRARRLTSKPLCAIGGIDVQNLQEVLGSGADSVVVLGAICYGDVKSNCERLLARAKEAS